MHVICLHNARCLFCAAVLFATKFWLKVGKQQLRTAQRLRVPFEVGRIGRLKLASLSLLGLSGNKETICTHDMIA